MKNKQLYILDLSRFIAAIAVLFWHYQHFYMVKGVYFIKEEQPFFNVVSVFYNYGFWSVKYFWILSGFVFFYTYSIKINTKEVGVRTYIINRVARLYPLHILTLIFTCILAFYFKSEFGYFFVYNYNDVKHFLLNVFFISHWGFQDGFSYNAPIWSVSVEMFSYIVFFIYCKVINVDIIKTSISVIVLVACNYFLDSDLLYCLLCFFVGGLSYHFYTYLAKCKINKMVLSLFILIVGLGVFYISYLIAFSMLVISMSIFQLYDENIGCRGKLLGDISFGVYLWHYPVQLILVVFVSREADFYNSKLTLIAFLISTIIISLISFTFYEKPMKNRFRHYMSAPM